MTILFGRIPTYGFEVPFEVRVMVLMYRGCYFLIQMITMNTGKLYHIMLHRAHIVKRVNRTHNISGGRH